MLFCRVLSAFFAIILFAMNITSGILYGIFSHEFYTLFCIVCGIIVSTFSMIIFTMTLTSIKMVPSVVSTGTAIYFWTMTIVAQVYDHNDIVPLAFVSIVYTLLSVIFTSRVLIKLIAG